MKRVKNSDIKFKINKKLVYLPNFVIRFYTVNQKEYFFEKTQDDLVEYEREATVDDVEVILSGGTTVTEYYLPLNWSELLFVGQGILNYKLTNNIEDPEFPDYQYNKEEVVTTDFYIDSIKVDPEPDEGLIERVVHLEEHLAEEIVNREEADAAISGAVDSEIARAVSAETALQEAIDDEIERAISAETLIVDALEAEANRAISAETALDAKIDQEIADRIADVNTEEARAISAETALQEAIDAEETRATSAETALNEALQTETNRAISAETALDTKIDAETNRATSAETALQSAINDEATARANADTALQTAITNEESRAREAESAITNALNAEVTRATGAENALDDKIDVETTRATGAEAALDVKIDTVSGNVISETTRAITAENALSGAIDSISAATSGSVEELDAKIDQEITDRTADVDAEETRAKGVENVLSGSIDTIDAKFIDDAKYEMSGQTHVINFYNGNTVKATIDCTDFLVDGMIDNVYIENGYLVIDFNTASGKQDIRIPLTDIFNPANYYTKSETSGATEIANALALKLNISDFNTYSGAVDTAINSKASQSTVDALNGVVTAHTADTSIHVTSNDKEKWNKVDDKADTTALTAVNDTLTAHTADTSIHLTSGDVQSQIDNSIDVVNQVIENNEEVTAQALNVLNGELANKLDVSAYTPVDLSNYYTKSETSGATELATALAQKLAISDFNTYTAATDTALSGKADTATTYTKTEVDNAITAATSTKQDQLVSSVNIKTINNESILGSGNIDIQGGGKAIEAGRGISVTTGETADTVSFNLPISATTNNNLIIGDESNQVNDLYNSGDSIVFGRYSRVKAYDSLVGGYYCSNEKGQSQVFGNNTKTKNITEFGCGKYNNSVSGSSTFGDSGNTLFSVGNGTADNARHNAFEIRQNGDIYLTKDGQDVKLQDQLGGGGGGITSGEVQTMIDQSISGKTNQSDFTAHTANTTAHVTQSEKNTWNAKSDFSGSYNDLTDKPTIPNYTAGSGITISNNVISAKIWSGTQAQYDALAVKDNDTIYLIYNS